MNPREKSRAGRDASLQIAESDRLSLVRRAFLLEWLTVGWLVIEGGVAIFAGFEAGSLTLTAFGFDSAIELASALVLIWRLNVELRQGAAFSETAERAAAKIAGGLLFGLAAYVVVGAAWAFWARHGERFSLPGLVVALASLPIMVFLARQKTVIAARLGSPALRADAIENIACAWLSLVVVIGLFADLLLGAWWVDAAASLPIVWLVVREGREAWSGEEQCGHCSSAAEKGR